MKEQCRIRYQEIQSEMGDKYMLLLAVEEMSELSQELLKNINRRKDNSEKITEELADVLSCLEYVKHIFNISDEQLLEITKAKFAKKRPK